MPKPGAVQIKSGGKHRIERVKLLIEKGVDLDYVDANGDTAMMLAARWGGQYDIALVLLESGANPFIYKANSNLRLAHMVELESLHRQKVWTPRQSKDFRQLVKRLEERGESFVEIRKDFARWKAESAGMSTSQMARLRDAEIAARLNRQRRKGMGSAESQTPPKLVGAIHRLIEHPNSSSDPVKTLKYLISKGAEVNELNHRGETPLLTAVRERQFDVALTLLESGADASLPLIFPPTGKETDLKLAHFLDQASGDASQFSAKQREAYTQLAAWIEKQEETVDRTEPAK